MSGRNDSEFNASRNLPALYQPSPMTSISPRSQISSAEANNVVREFESKLNADYSDKITCPNSISPVPADIETKANEWVKAKSYEDRCFGHYMRAIAQPKT
ncbi:unnamed protein product [Adineta ricciae]|uniref:Uncharacterized protein n=1 Tax=Adineta ricciae TaxID=249248 RepID=A0A815NPB6_ADIRI|nr:unnamed protein product [Adineta ricciae]